MLVNTRSDREFQRYCDREEQRLHVKLVPILTAAIKIQVNTNATRAEDYITERGLPVLVAHTTKIYRDQFRAITKAVVKKAAGDDEEDDEGGFLRRQLTFIRREAAAKIVRISRSLTERIRGLVLAGVEEGDSNQEIKRDIIEQAPEIGRTRAAMIARTETHNSALDAIDATLEDKNIEVKQKQWWSAADGRVRPTHMDVHGEIVNADEPFNVGGYEMMRPGDDSLGAGPEEIINCRCAILYLTTSEPGGGSAGGGGAATEGTEE